MISYLVFFIVGAILTLIASRLHLRTRALLGLADMWLLEADIRNGKAHRLIGDIKTSTKEAADDKARGNDVRTSVQIKLIRINEQLGRCRRQEWRYRQWAETALRWAKAGK